MEGITPTDTAMAATTTDSKPAMTLMDLPLEVRYKIFEHAAIRETKPKKLLRYWFEKKEVKELVAKEIAQDPTAVPRVIYGVDAYYDSDDEAADDGEEDDEDDEDNEDEDEDEDEDENENEEEEVEVEEQEEEEEDDENNEEDSGESGELNATAGVIQTNQADNEEEETNVNQDGDEPTTEDEDGEAAATNTNPPPPPPPPQPIVRAHHKWRYIPNFMRMTQCPPPIELFLVSPQLSKEAKSWFYDVAVLHINATGSFAHTSFFEEAFTQITEAAFSPMENIRKVEVRFVWDTAWIRADTTGMIEAIFPAMLRQRASFVVQILLQAPDLKEVVIHWHDSAQDSESAVFMLDILGDFYNLPADIRVEEHYIASDAEPSDKSIAGMQRVEFQRIVDSGLDRVLF